MPRPKTPSKSATKNHKNSPAGSNEENQRHNSKKTTNPHRSPSAAAVTLPAIDLPATTA